MSSIIDTGRFTESTHVAVTGEQGLGEEEALKRGQEEKSREFVENGAEVS